MAPSHIFFWSTARSVGEKGAGSCSQLCYLLPAELRPSAATCYPATRRGLRRGPTRPRPENIPPAFIQGSEFPIRSPRVASCDPTTWTGNPLGRSLLQAPSGPPMAPSHKEGGEGRG